jgi:NACalpha-BTF3-like transcription factor
MCSWRDCCRPLAHRANSQEDVAVVMAEFEVEKEVADRVLRENRGDLTAALTAMLAS